MMITKKTFSEYAESLQPDGSILCRLVKVYGPKHQLYDKARCSAICSVSRLLAKNLPDRKRRAYASHLLRNAIAYLEHGDSHNTP